MLRATAIVGEAMGLLEDVESKLLAGCAAGVDGGLNPPDSGGLGCF